MEVFWDLCYASLVNFVYLRKIPHLSLSTLALQCILISDRTSHPPFSFVIKKILAILKCLRFPIIFKAAGQVTPAPLHKKVLEIFFTGILLSLFINLW